jgi:hypothetical protein
MSPLHRVCSTFSLFLIGSMPAGGGGGPGGGPFALTVISPFLCVDLPRCNLLLASRRLAFVFIAAPPAPRGGEAFVAGGQL